jgi:hypothetical protein
VIPSNFNWTKYVQGGRVKRIQNYVASSDWVVAIFPNLFEQLHLQDIGSAGHNGFISNEGKKLQIEYVKGDHGAALTKVLFPNIADFALGSAETPSVPNYVDNPESWVQWAGKLCWLAWLVIIACFVVLPVLLLFHWPAMLCVYFVVLLVVLFTF